MCFYTSSPWCIFLSLYASRSCHADLVFDLICASRPCLSLTTLFLLLIPDLEIRVQDSNVITCRGSGCERYPWRSPKPECADLLVVNSKSTLMRFPVSCLKDFCEEHGLVVCPTGQRGCIKKDYAVAIWFHVSYNSG